MEKLLQDLRFAVRLLAQKPLFTLVAALSLGLGIGANAAIFSLVNALLLRSLPVAAPDRLVSIFLKEEKNRGFFPLSHLNWADLRAQSRSFSGILGYDWVGVGVQAGGGEAALATAQLVSENYFDVLGLRAARGRTFSREEGSAGGPPVAVASHRFWSERLGGSAAAVGSTVRVDGAPFTVIGVAPERFTGVDTGLAPDLWIPMARNRQIRSNPATNWYEQRRGLFVFAVGRLRPGVALAAARAELEAIAATLEREYPQDNKGRSVQLVPLAEAAINPAARGVVVAGSVILLVVVGLVLLIACANVANLLLARAAARQREIAIRLSQGASRGRLIRQLLTESVLLALLGAVVGLAIAWVAQRGLLALLPTLGLPVPVALDLGLDLRVLAFTLGLAVATGLLFGLAPALAASRPELVSALKNQAGSTGGRRGAGLLRGGLVVGQVALSLVALIAAGLFVRSLGAARKIQPGFDSGRLGVLSFDLSLQGIDPARGEPLLRQVAERAAALPGVAGVALAQAGPFQGSLMRSVYPEGGRGPGAMAEEGKGVLVPVNAVAPEYFRTMGIPLLHGRGFGLEDRLGGNPVVIVNQTMAERFWPGQEPVGQRFHFFGEPPVTVVGVARNAVYGNPGEDPQSYVYRPLAQAYSSQVTLIARADRPAAALPALQREVRAAVKGVPLVNVSTVDELLARSLGGPRLAAELLGLFGGLALLLAAIGLYGVLSYSVSQRSREIGMRMALGAERGRILGLVLSQGLALVAAGLALGLGLAYSLARFAAGLLIGIAPTDPAAFGGTALILALVALLATLLPAQRATAVDPLVALRYE